MPLIDENQPSMESIESKFLSDVLDEDGPVSLQPPPDDQKPAAENEASEESLPTDGKTRKQRERRKQTKSQMTDGELEATG